MQDPGQRVSFDQVGAGAVRQAHPTQRPRRFRPIGTQALIALNAGVFMLQMSWGATSSVAGLAAMGAMAGPLVAEGQWWRLASATVLHGGLMHLLMNSYALYILGSFMERLLGTGRMLFLYIVSGVFASFGSYLYGTPLGVGASGAVFGLLGAQSILAFFPRGLLPPQLLPAARRATFVNLAINVGISFLPFIDIAAHLSGAAMGAALAFTGVVLPNVRAPIQTQVAALKSWFLRGVAVAAVYVAVALFGVFQGAPWRGNDAAPSEHWTRGQPADTGVG